ncbi:hypothetical protein [Chitinophaga sp. CB10]|uniref:LIC11966 family surface protein n=1 Tax=Chitinophaga sp. CB10 TaxID=1891659 RepID=UPI0025B80F84|nr:hypothetical protein [Chitinophaga sp. CB10]
MKKVNSILALFGAALISMNVVSCDTAVDPVEHNNKLMTVMNENEKDMNAMNGAMSSQDYAKAETVRKSWSEHLDKSIETVGKMKSIDDAGLKDAVTQGLKDYKKLADEDYKTLIDLRTKEKGGDLTVQPQIQSTLDKINHSFESIGNKINQASDAFEKKVRK